MKINPKALAITCLSHEGQKLGERFVKLWNFLAFNLLIFSTRLCPLIDNVSPEAILLFAFFFSLVFLSSSINSSSASKNRKEIHET